MLSVGHREHLRECAFHKNGVSQADSMENDYWCLSDYMQCQQANTDVVSFRLTYCMSVSEATLAIDDFVLCRHPNLRSRSDNWFTEQSDLFFWIFAEYGFVHG